MFKLNKLEWDSHFFNLEIAEMHLINAHNESIKDNALLKYDLIVLKNTNDRGIKINNFLKSFNEVKITFLKELEENTIKDSIEVLDTDSHPMPEDTFYDLAFESGQHSRFKLDTNIKKSYFRELYRTWVKNSLNKSFADKVLYIKNDKEIIGFVTIKLNADDASIGLIAISNKHQGKGLGNVLLKSAENFCINNGRYYLKIPTQKKNIQACKFYHKNGYTIDEQLYITHFWNLNNDPV